MTDQPNVEPHFPGDRGFAHFDPVTSDYGGTLRVYESSAALSPHIWAMAVVPANLNDPTGAQVEATLHLPLDEAVTLRDQLTWLIDNHYQVKPRSRDGST